MKRYVATAGVLLALFFAAARRAPTQPASSQSPVVPNVKQSAARDGSHDFDWDIGTWKTHQKRLLHPLTGSTTWVEYQGSDVVRRIWDGANEGLVEAQGPAGRLKIYTLRVYNPDAHQWNIYFTNPATGVLGPPAVGEFKNGRGEFYDQEMYNGRAILVRFAVFDITPDSCRFEQAFSADGGKTWEANFIVTEVLVKNEGKSGQ
jgi:hypothetical protein